MLINNPKMNIAGTIFSAPLFENGKERMPVNDKKLFLLKYFKKLSPEVGINPVLNVSNISSQSTILKWYLTCHRVVLPTAVMQASSIIPF
jgi:hypothetical protein